MGNYLNTRPITAFAFLADKLSQGGDFFSGLIPLFSPVINPLAGKRFEPNQLSDLLADYYGMDIHPYAIESLAPRLEEQGLLERKEISANTIEFYYQKVEGEFYEVQDNLVENVTAQFKEFANEQLSALKIHLDDRQLTNALLDRLKKAEFFGVLIKSNETSSKNTLTLKPTQTDATHEEQNNYESRLDILVASFLLNAHANKPDLFELLVKITTGALIAEVILDFRHPYGLKNLNGLQIFLDTPFLMSLFDLGSKLGTSYAAKLYKQLQEVGANLTVFRHTIDEFKDNLKAVLTAKSEGRAFGETASRLTDPIFKVYATTLLPILEHEISKKGIVIAVEPNANLYRFFTLEEEKELASRFTFHSSYQARERDAHSIACVMRFRSGVEVTFSDFQSCRSIFLTKNGGLVSITERQLRELGKLHERDVPPCITDRYFAGLLWIMYGGEKDGLPEHRLLANCARAVQASANVISKMHDILAHVSPSQVEHFSALMTSERSSQYFMQLTLGDPILITEENYLDLYRKLEIVVGERVARQKDSEISKIKESHAKEIQEAAAKEAIEHEQLMTEKRILEENYQNQAKLQSAAILEAQNESLRHHADKLQTQQELEVERKEKEGQQLVIISEALRLGRKGRQSIVVWTIVISVFLFILLNITDKYILPSLAVGSLLSKLTQPVYWFLVLIQFVLSFWFIPDILFGRYAQKKQKEITEHHLRKFNLTISHLEKYDIDWAKGVVIGKKSE